MLCIISSGKIRGNEGFMADITIKLTDGEVSSLKKILYGEYLHTSNLRENLTFTRTGKVRNRDHGEYDYLTREVAKLSHILQMLDPNWNAHGINPEP